MKEYKILKSTTTEGQRYLVILVTKCKEFKTQKGAINYINKIKKEEV